ncbi:hypothetical protein K443DRAFT_15046 [Laccaria amethystina LaAM-08-1]|uniref:Uncharacterized protein n=1 Tax=Laccaria amethystina LaAM-08-1 TaxID=1095629 RepID=A0A0C9X280_9AGAR|nr:hypothetical protein K443DRAFT_15046 [Laccaria amethystina LaAM-08-1]
MTPGPTNRHWGRHVYDFRCHVAGSEVAAKQRTTTEISRSLLLSSVQQQDKHPHPHHTFANHLADINKPTTIRNHSVTMTGLQTNTTTYK